MSDLISFDDLLGEASQKKVKKKRDAKASKPYQPSEHRETRANWKTPKPEAVILFWTETKCQNCGKIHSHPTYERNSCLVRFRVSRFRSILRPFSQADAIRLAKLPRMLEVHHSTVAHCMDCFEDAFLSDGEQLDMFGSPVFTPADEEHTPQKPFIQVATDDDMMRLTQELNKQGGEK